SLPQLPADAGQLRLSQQFSSGAPQLLLQRGSSAGDGQAVTFDSGNPNWKLEFSPGPAATASLSPAILALAALLALAGALLGLMLTRNHLLGRLRGDVQQLAGMLQELAVGKSVKSFSLHFAALDGLAQSLARLPRGRQEAPATATNGAPKAAQPTEPLADPLFQATDIL